VNTSSFYNIKAGDRRRHEDIGPVKIFEVKGANGLLVAVELGLHGEAVSVYSIDDLDPLGWSRVRRPHSSVSPEEKEKIRKLRLEGKSARAISDDLGFSRSFVQRTIQALEVIPSVQVKVSSKKLDEVKIKKIRRLLKRNWRSQTIADQLSVSPETVRQIQEKMRSEQDVRALP
jgi:DNA invertase Pin-like site-specific DNA recombinase